MNESRNISFATIEGIRDILQEGANLTVRGSEVREILNRVTVLAHPRERCLFVPQRKNNIFITLAETLWVMGGRNDIEWLQNYLPRAKDFSDDGKVWRAGYGKRLRHWNGVDQFDEIRKLLLKEPLSRRAVMTLYDPGKDFVDSLDIPCNNWLHWMIRNERLYLNVAVRSNDAIWGFSGVNSFEWSVLQEMMAYWLGVEVGPITFLASSFHLYPRHYDMAREALKSFRGVTCYDFGLKSPTFETCWDDFNEKMASWYSNEEAVRRNPEFNFNKINDDFLDTSLGLMRIYHGGKKGWSVKRIGEELSGLNPCDLVAAAYEYYIRKMPDMLEHVVDNNLESFLQEWISGPKEIVSSVELSSLISLIKNLHRKKDNAYGNSWKRRGESVSILANIARKVDRIENYSITKVELDGETALDTAIDLFVYLIKYQLFLMELDNRLVPVGCGDLIEPFSDHTSNFDRLVDQMVISETRKDGWLSVSRKIVADFDGLYQAFEKNLEPFERFELARTLGSSALELAVLMTEEHPNDAQNLLNT